MFLRSRFAVFTSLRTSLCVTASLICLLSPLGCANPGQPKPPSLRLPEKAKQPAAERVGDQVILTWNTPPKTTDGNPIRGPITARICREAPTARSGATPPCNTIQRLTVAPGPGRAVETLPANLTSGAPTLLTYRIELLNPASRSVGLSDPIYAAAGAAPPPAGTLTITARREGALIAWTRTANPAPMNLTRTLLQQPDAPKPAPAKPQPLGFTSSTKANTPIVNLTSPAQSAADPGGMIDQTIQDRSTYTYVAERVQTVVLAGHPLALRGPSSPAATFTYRDIFPPSPPPGLISVPGGGFGAAPSIDLSWDPNPETDILGYNVYRSDAGGAPSFVRQNPDPLPTSAYRDLRVEPGHTYIYRVTAIDQQHNESAPGDAIHETLRK